jgi:MoaA/NifB/PqqE/SkfB family radical SAM enzyme
VRGDTNSDSTLRHGKSGSSQIGSFATGSPRLKVFKLGHLVDCAKFEVQQRSHRISVLPIVILYLNNICDSRCATCSIWKNNEALKLPEERQMSDALLKQLYSELPKWSPRQILLSGGEPAIHPRFPEVIRNFKSLPSSGCVVSNGLLLGSNDAADLQQVSEFYISFDAPDRKTYETIRGVDGFERLARTVAVLNSLPRRPRIVARCTLQRANVGRIPELTKTASDMGFDTISFLGVDVGSSAFSRDLHGVPDTEPIRPTRDDLIEMRNGIESLGSTTNRFIEGGVGKLERLLQYFRALLGEAEFPEVRCNAPWFSTVIETTGAIRGCFFQPIIGDFRSINGDKAVGFRQSLNVGTDPTCQGCVCSKALGARDLLRI